MHSAKVCRQGPEKPENEKSEVNVAKTVVSLLQDASVWVLSAIHSISEGDRG